MVPSEVWVLLQAVSDAISRGEVLFRPLPGVLAPGAGQKRTGEERVERSGYTRLHKPTHTHRLPLQHLGPQSQIKSMGLYRPLYRRRRYRCHYCGDRADGKDHIPPLDWVEGKDFNQLMEAGPLVIVECCRKCNNRLGNKLLTLAEREEFIRS